MNKLNYVSDFLTSSSANGLTSVQLRELSNALALSEDVSPCPAAAHTALLILRSTLAKALRVSEAELLAATGVRSPNPSELPAVTDKHFASTFEASAQ